MNEARVGKRDRAILECAVDTINTKLVVDEEIDGHCFVGPSPRSSAGHLHDIRTKRRKRIQSFLAARCRTDEETFEESGSREGEESPVDKHYRPEPCDNHCLLSV